MDALGIVAMLGRTAGSRPGAPDCREPVLQITAGELGPVGAVVHYAVPAARWWDNIGFS